MPQGEGLNALLQVIKGMMGQHTHPRLDRLQTVSVGNLRRTNLRRSADSSPEEQHGRSSMLEESVTRVLDKRIALAALTTLGRTDENLVFMELVRPALALNRR